MTTDQKFAVVMTVVTVGALGLAAVFFEQCWSQLEADAAASRKLREEFMAECMTDGKKRYECDVLWAEANR